MKTKLKFAAVLLSVMLVAMLIQPSLAYYTVIGRATNVVTSGSIELEIIEETAEGEPYPTAPVSIIPGQVVSKVVSIRNICDHPFHLRLKLVNASNNDKVIPGDVLDINIDHVNWKENGGYYYYHGILQPGETTEPLFTEVKFNGEYLNQTHVNTLLSLTVEAYAVQSENNPAEHPWDASGWPSEEVGE